MAFNVMNFVDLFERIGTLKIWYANLLRKPSNSQKASVHGKYYTITGDVNDLPYIFSAAFSIRKRLCLLPSSWWQSFYAGH